MGIPGGVFNGIITTLIDSYKESAKRHLLLGGTNLR